MNIPIGDGFIIECNNYTQGIPTLKHNGRIVGVDNDIQRFVEIIYYAIYNSSNKKEVNIE